MPFLSRARRSRPSSRGDRTRGTASRRRRSWRLACARGARLALFMVCIVVIAMHTMEAPTIAAAETLSACWGAVGGCRRRRGDVAVHTAHRELQASLRRARSRLLLRATTSTFDHFEFAFWVSGDIVATVPQRPAREVVEPAGSSARSLLTAVGAAARGRRSRASCSRDCAHAVGARAVHMRTARSKFSSRWSSRRRSRRSSRRSSSAALFC